MTEFTFEAGKAIEIAFASIRKGFEMQIQDEYFPKAMPLIQEYGGRPIGRLAVESTPFGHIQCDVVMFFEWPSVDAYTKFCADERFQPIRAIRDEAAAYLNNGNFFSVENTVTASLDSQKVYPLFGAWVDAKRAENVMIFQQNVATVQEEIGVRNLVRFEHLASSPGPFRPDFVGLTQWPGADEFQQFIMSEVYRENVHHRDLGAKRFDLFVTKSQ